VIATDCAAHREQLVEQFAAAFRAKYDAGQREHGGRVWRKPNMLREGTHEILDLWVYLKTEEAQKCLVRRLLADAMASNDWGAVAEAYNVLTAGNPEGEREEDR